MVMKEKVGNISIVGMKLCIIFVVLDLNTWTCLVVGFGLHVEDKITYEVLGVLEVMNFHGEDVEEFWMVIIF